MQKDEAQNIFGLESEANWDHALEAYQAQVFGLRDYLLRNATIPKVFRAKLAKVERLFSALNEFGEPKEDILLPERMKLSGAGMVEFIRSYDNQKMALRTGLAQSWYYPNISDSVDALIELEKDFSTRFREFQEQFDVKTPQSVSALQQLDTGKFLTLLTSEKHKEELDDLYAKELERLKRLDFKK